MDKQAQMSFNFEPGISTKFPTVRRYIDEKINRGKKQREYVAADMGLSPSCLTRKINQNPNDKRTFGTDDLCAYMETQNDYSPILWFLDKYGHHLRSLQEAEIQKQIDDLQAMLDASRIAGKA